MEKIEQVKKESIEEFGSQFTRERYEKVAEQGLWGSEEILVNKYFKQDSNILDIGCGSGRTTFPLRKLGYIITGVDITPAMIATAKKVALAKGMEIRFFVGDATSLDFPDNHFEGAICANNGWAQIPGKDNRQIALNEIYRVLKPGGYFIFTAHQRYYSDKFLFSWIESWIRYYMLKPLGFTTKEIDFGDFFFARPYKIDNKTPIQFIHMGSMGEVIKQIKKSGFKLEMAKRMAEIAEADAISMRGSLTKDFDSFKSPVFYICLKKPNDLCR